MCAYRYEPRIGVALIAVLLLPFSAQAGECIDWSDESCAVCIRDLVKHGKNLKSLYKQSHTQQPPAELKGTKCEKDAGSWYCFPQICLVGPALQAIIELDPSSDKAATILGTLTPYRSCGKENVPALKLMLAHYPKATSHFQKAARQVLGNLRTEGKGWGDFARPCVKLLREHVKDAPQELKAAMWVGLARLAIWEAEPVLKELRANPAIRRYAESRFPFPKCLQTYFGVEQQGLLRLVGTDFLRKLRNAVFARHGRKFESPDLQAFFKSQPWYQPRNDFSRKKLDRGDRINIKLVTAEEQRRKKTP
jgi:hypothetical protein